VRRSENSVAEALGQAHRTLLADLVELEQAVFPSSGESLAELRAQLGEVHAHVTEHFRFEEQNGYLDSVRKREPRLERTVQQLAEEHGQLRQSLDALIREARAATSLGHTLRDEVREWIERVRQHESRENDLVQDAFNLDISAED
jgi:hypothetical protein